MEDRSKMKNPARSYAFRPGNARLGGAGGMLLGIGALVSACVAGYALWTLTEPMTKQPKMDQRVDQRDGQTDGAIATGRGIAPTESIEEILGAVQVYVREQQYAQATTVLEHASSQFPDDLEIHLALGDLYMLQKMNEQAYAQYLSAIEIGPSTGDMEFSAGTLANMLGQFELAQSHLSAAMRLDPSNPDAPIYLAAIELKLNRLADAKSNLALAEKIAPDQAKIYAMRSEIAMRENKLGIALEQISKARELEPRVLAWVVAHAKVLKRSRDPEAAISLLVSLGEAELENPEVAYVLAECYGMVGRPGDAASRLMDVAQVHRDDAKLAFEVALWLERAGERADAIEWAGTAHRLGNTRAKGWIESLP